MEQRGRGAEGQRGRGERTWYLNSPLLPCSPAPLLKSTSAGFERCGEKSGLGWSLAGILAAITAWRYVIHCRTPEKISVYYLAASLLLTVLVGVQVYFGDELVWVYGLHTVPVVEAIKEGLLQ